MDLYKYWDQERPDGGAGRLHVYVPATLAAMETRRLRPAVLILPGGGYHHVSQREGEPVALRFLCRGYCAFVLDYSVAPLGFPVQLREAAMAMAYIRQNASALGIHPQMVAAVGFSAGGHLCGMLGTMYDACEVADLGDARLLRPDVLGLCYPVTVSRGKIHAASFENLCGNDLALWERLSLDRLVRPDMPPVYLWHTFSDESVPCSNSLVMAQALESVGVPMAMRLYARGPHGLSTADAQAYPAGEVPQMSPDVPKWPEDMMGFFGEMGLKIKDEEHRL